MTTEQEIDSVKKQIEFADHCIGMLKQSKIKKSEVEKTEAHRVKLQDYLETLEAKLLEESEDEQ